MLNYVELKIEVNNNQQKDILLALLAEAGANGFEEEKNLLVAFFNEENYNESICRNIIEEKSVNYSMSVIKEKNWNAEWEADFKPVLIGNFCAIRAAFHPANGDAQHDIIITPKMSFGTGHHATTHMMVAAMEGLDFSGKAVFDFGTGTGVLSILAEKCGAAKIVAVDNDEWSINNAMENFNSNNSNKVLLYNSEGFVDNLQYDIILANINRHIILQNMASIKQHLATKGVVLLSGLLTGDEPVIMEEALNQELKPIKRFEMSGWICLLMANG